mgnify:CR=1 FL=1
MNNNILSIDGVQKNSRISIYDITGIPVFNGITNPEVFNYDLNNRNLNGIFIIKGADYTKKIVVF